MSPFHAMLLAAVVAVAGCHGDPPPTHEEPLVRPTVVYDDVPVQLPQQPPQALGKPVHPRPHFDRERELEGPVPHAELDTPTMPTDIEILRAVTANYAHP